ncbi:STAS domain-containing protein [Novosphingobium sp. 1949]|uniref:STAS domain-containing protein n=1 Tax=Novosphingobium organovorum TaxID=2930092 RepID=A0ABT0BFY4_9SPHN|nr:STAS domain-containing protein [Novosphingobium organovorum]MCJ2183967.1 STAS domain-containing protein [Novosphingobium organovorum]
MLVTLGQSATIRTVHEVRNALLEGFEKDGAVTVDAARVEEVDLSLIQLLDAARTHAAAKGLAFALTAPANAALAAMLERNGFLTAPSSAELAFWLQGETQQ